MELQFNEFFIVYVSVFLAAIVGAWLILVWKDRVSHRKETDYVSCPFCGAQVVVNPLRVRIRCGRCHGRFKLSDALSASESRVHTKQI